MANIPTMTAATHKGGRFSANTIAPSTSADNAMPTSSPGKGMPIKPIIPPSAMTMGKVIGKTQMAGAPSCAPHIPTATIARI